MNQEFYSRGKLLITGEYLVLKGAKAIALPLNLGQKLTIQTTHNNVINWVSIEKDKEIFSAKFNSANFSILACSHQDKASYIAQLLIACRSLNPDFIDTTSGYDVTAQIEFDMQWGLGTSSTLINNLAQWAQINPFQLNSLVSKGSGYDIACASANQPILYELIPSNRIIKWVDFSPSFLANLTLVHLNKKMATEKNIANFLQNSTDSQVLIEKINILTQKILECSVLNEFMSLIALHEQLIGKALNQTPVKQKLFQDFDGEIKSLGAWGGDFILAAAENNFEKQKNYFNNKGYKTVMPLNKLIIQKI